MEYSFPRYLLSKQSVDDRALNKDVLDALKRNLPQQPFRIIEVGAGIGTMLKRLVRWNIIHKADYVLVDEMEENIAYAREWIPQWTEESGLSMEGIGQGQLRVFDQSHEVRIKLECADVFDFIKKNRKPANLLIAHAFLDLLPMPDSLQKLFSLTNHLAWLTINFDGVTSFEPAIDSMLDEKIEQLYHATMDTRPTGGDSRAGRHLFSHLASINAQIIATGASDWVVYAINGKYADDEKYFLQYILHFLEDSLKEHMALATDILEDWLTKRRAQIELGKLTYIAHQMDFLVRP